ncbi:MAG: hypothetical protein R3233_00445 [Xanthomonadales bacterium]|nr:hypothetical protein [Xanthomonadales bacterium]
MAGLKRGSLVVAAVLGLGLAAYLLWPAPQPDAAAVAEESQPQLTPDEATGNPPTEAPTAEATDEARVLSERAQELGETRQSELRQLAVTRHPFPHDVRMDDYKAALWSEIQANPPRFETPGDPAVDAELAYRLYMYYGMCTMAPRTVQQVDQSLERIVDRAERARGRYLQGLEQRADQTMDMYELCLPIPLDVDPRAEAVVWMTEAVRLGHEIAQVQYYEKIMGFLLRGDRWLGGPPLVMQNPELIWEFRSTARRALESAVENGHPEAWLAMSEAVSDGVVFEKNPVLALAYARVAELEAMENRIILNDLEEQKFAAGQFLDEMQKADAEELAQRLRSGE